MSGNGKIVLYGDLHCHTIASTHAYSTFRENLEAAKQKKLSVLAITDHAPGMADGATLSYFDNLLSLPQEVDGIKILRGVEANIIDFDGNLDMPNELLERLDIVIASFHSNCTKYGSIADHTKAYLQIAENPNVDIIGHCGTEEFKFDYDTVIPTLGKAGKLIEINAHSFICRQSSIKNCRHIAELCAKHNLPIVVDSDAHSEFEVGQCDLALDMLKEINFPKELIINADINRLQNYISSKRK